MINAHFGKKENTVEADKIFNGRTLILDGGMGTMLQKYGIMEHTELLGVTNPDILTKIHSQYVEAGSNIIYASTFSANELKLKDSGYSVEQVIDGAIKAAKKACRENTLVALDMTSLGVMMEPAGTMTFEEAYEQFVKIAKAGEKSGADLAVIETMTDLYETKAALLAVKENTSLPVIVSMSFEEDGRTFTGCSVECMAATLEGLGAAAIGINCSLGPDEIFPIAERLCKCTSLPVFIKPNAGLPDPKDNTYHLDADSFCAAMEKYKTLGLAAVGGCCGTTPDFIRAVADSFKNERIAQRTAPDVCTVCSQTKAVCIDRVAVIGERINPTGKKRFRQALAERDFDYILSQAIEQVEAGADILDVNVGTPGIDEVTMLPELVKRLQSVVDLPLQIDTTNPLALEAALRVYCGKAIVNSVNGTEKSLDAVLPVVKKYGAAVVALTIDDDGIPDEAERRVEIAEKIVNRAESVGIPRRDVFVDCLTMAVSAQADSALQTTKALRTVKEKLNVKTVLGVSNISFGLPNRPLLNRNFLSMALANGLDLPIINPNDTEMMDTVAAYELLNGRDKAAEGYLERFSGEKAETVAVKTEHDVAYYIKKGLNAETLAAVNKLLETNDEMTVVNDFLIPSLDEVGKDYENKKLFLPQLLNAAGAAQCAFDAIRDRMASKGGDTISKGKIVIATVQGDIHDIGKNIVKTVLANYGYTMIDLGRDVKVQSVVDAVLENDVSLLGLSALMTTTLPAMEATIKAVKKAKPDCRIMVGGAVLTEDYAMSIGADFYCKDAMQSVEAARKVLG